MIVVVNGDREITLPNSEINKNMEEFDIDRLTAARMFLEDNAFILPENHDRVEEKEEDKPSKKTRVATSGNSKAKKERVRKVDETKGEILKDIKELLEARGVENIITKTETELNFTLKDEDYTLKLTKHRKTKK